MKIELLQDHQSLKAFAAQEIPDFTLLTGLNGSGKTQLLQGVRDAIVRVIGVDASSSDRAQLISYFDPRAFAIDLGNYYEAFNNLASRDDSAEFAEVTFRSCREEWRAWGQSRGYNEAQLRSITVSAAKSVTDFQHDIEYVNDLRALMAKWRADTSSPAYLPNEHRENIEKAATQSNVPYFLVARADVQRAVLDPIPFFQSSIYAVFHRYRDRYFRNTMARMQHADGASANAGLTAAEFRETYGPPPWETLNGVFAALGLEARLNAPRLNDMSPFDLTLSLPDGKQVSFDSLSSGERVIAMLALCGYQQSNNAEKLSIPKVVLLDEVDSPLHPSMVRTYLSVITSTLVDTFKMKVIASTHSPSTVALFPGAEIGLMEKGVPGIRMVARDAALAALTQGVPTLSISVDGRRQVFVESPADVENYETLYELLKPRLASERSLQFVATGTREANSGCDVVIRVVEALAESGSATTYGLIDWDGKHKAAGRLIVLAEGRRDGLENVIFDPLIVTLSIYRDFSRQLANLGLPDAVTYMELATIRAEVVQPLVTRVVEQILGKAASNTTTIEYVGGLQLQVDSDYLLIDDHTLEGKLTTVLPFLLDRSKRQAGKLMQYFLDAVLRDHPEAIPVEIRTAFETLLAS